MVKITIYKFCLTQSHGLVLLLYSFRASLNFFLHLVPSHLPYLILLAIY